MTKSLVALALSLSTLGSFVSSSADAREATREQANQLLKNLVGQYDVVEGPEACRSLQGYGPFNLIKEFPCISEDSPCATNAGIGLEGPAFGILTMEVFSGTTTEETNRSCTPYDFAEHVTSVTLQKIHTDGLEAVWKGCVGPQVRGKARLEVLNPEASLVRVTSYWKGEGKDAQERVCTLKKVN